MKPDNVELKSWQVAYLEWFMENEKRKKQLLAGEIEPHDFMVETPPHYNKGEVECIDAMRAQCTEEEFATYCRLNAFKYIWRAPHKGLMHQDIRKAMWYLSMSIGKDPRKGRPNATQ